MRLVNKTRFPRSALREIIAAVRDAEPVTYRVSPVHWARLEIVVVEAKRLGVSGGEIRIPRAWSTLGVEQFASAVRWYLHPEARGAGWPTVAHVQLPSESIARDEPKPKAAVPQLSKRERDADGVSERAQLLKRQARWQSRLKRAETALRTIAKDLKRVDRKAAKFRADLEAAAGLAD